MESWYAAKDDPKKSIKSYVGEGRIMSIQGGKILQAFPFLCIIFRIQGSHRVVWVTGITKKVGSSNATKL